MLNKVVIFITILSVSVFAQQYAIISTFSTLQCLGDPAEIQALPLTDSKYCDGNGNLHICTGNSLQIFKCAEPSCTGCSAVSVTNTSICTPLTYASAVKITCPSSLPNPSFQYTLTKAFPGDQCTNNADSAVVTYYNTAGCLPHGSTQFSAVTSVYNQGQSFAQKSICQDSSCQNCKQVAKYTPGCTVSGGSAVEYTCFGMYIVD